MQNNHRAHATEQSRSSLDRTVDDEKRRAGPLGREFRVLVLSVQDLLEHLQDDAHEFAVQADCFADMSVRGAHEKYLAWREMYATLDDCLRDLDQMLPMFRLERVPLFGIYDRIRSLKKRWMKQRVDGFYRLALEPDGLDEKTRTILRQEEAHLTSIVNQLKELVAAAP